MTEKPNTDATNFTWLLDSFVNDTTGVTDAVAVSSDGLLISMSSTLERSAAEKVSAMIAGFVSLGTGASQIFGFGGLNQIIVALNEGFVFVASISGGSCIGVVANKACDIGLVGHHTRLLVERAGAVLTPGLIAELRDRVLA
jgi:predicted regulator of Ras-like GTPase activity (Roadblock/LC7/MglB family)